MASDEDLLKEAREAYDLCVDADSHNRVDALDDLKFARLSEQWPLTVRNARERANRPCITVNKLPTFIRQVVNDARENKPSIKVHPVDSSADPMTAKVFDGLIRNIESSSNADVAYDTAADFAVTCGFGFWRIRIEYAHEDQFEKDILIDRVSNPFAVYGDPYSTAADSSDWNTAFVTDPMPVDEFKATYKGKDAVDWDQEAYKQAGVQWFDGKTVMVAEWWKRQEVDKTLLKLSNGEIVAEDEMEAMADVLQAQGITVVGQRATKGYKVTQRIMTGAEILETTDWAGRWIPIIPVYGDEVNVEGKRYFRSLIRDAKDAQRMHNYWRTTATEMVALAPKAPWLVEENSMPEDSAEAAKWDTANTEAHNYLMFKGGIAPLRLPMPPAAVGAMQEALAANDDMKAIMGLYDASLGQRSNETSGKAILARQHEGDISTFHFVDNVSRAIRHTGRILLDLIPKVYTGERIVRVLGEDGSVATVQLGQGAPQGAPQPAPPPAAGPMSPAGAPPGAPPAQTQGGLPVGVERIYDLSAGKYDLVVQAGPSYTTRRQEAAEQMMTLISQYPQAAPVIGDLLVKNLDWPGADEIADRLKAMAPQPHDPNAPPPVDPKVQAQIAADQQKAANDQQIAQANLQLDAQKQAQQMDMARQKQAFEQQLKAQEFEFQKQLEIMKAGFQADQQQQQFAHEQGMANQRFTSETDMANRKAQGEQGARDTEAQQGKDTIDGIATLRDTLTGLGDFVAEIRKPRTKHTTVHREGNKVIGATTVEA